MTSRRRRVHQHGMNWRPMTSTEFSARYRILRALAQDGVRTFTAQHVGTQRPVMVHFLDAVAPETRAELLARVERLEATDRARVLERVEVDGAPVLVTQVLASFETLPAWLAARTAAVQTHVAPPPPPSIDREVSRMSVFDAPTAPMQVVAAPSPAEPAPPVVPAPPSAPAKPPGEFTRLFASAAAAPVEAPVPQPVPATPLPSSAPIATSPMPGASSPAPRAAEPGEFTRLFRQASAPPSAPAAMSPASPMPSISPMSPASPMPSMSPPPRNEAHASRAPLAPTPMAPIAPMPPPVRPSAPMSGSATGALEARPVPSAPVPAPRPAAISPADPAPPMHGGVPLDFPPPLPPSLASGPASPGPAPFSSPPPPPPPPLALPQGVAGPLAQPRSTGPSEFTRVIAGASIGAAPVSSAGSGTTTPAADAGAPAAAASSSAAAAAPADRAFGPKANAKFPLVPMLIALNLIVLATIALVVFFALKD